MMDKSTSLTPTAPIAPTARACVKDMIYRYVQRGDTIAQLCAGSMGCVTRAYDARIGGYAWYQQQARKLTNHQLAVTKVWGQPCLELFTVDELVHEIQRECATGQVVPTLMQPSLW